MNRAVQTRLRRERGSVLISGMLLTLALLMVLGAAVDIGHAFIVRRDLSSLADGAALAGAQQLDQQAIHEGQLALGWQALFVGPFLADQRVTGDNTPGSAPLDEFLGACAPLLLRRLGLQRRPAPRPCPGRVSPLVHLL